MIEPSERILHSSATTVIIAVAYSWRCQQRMALVSSFFLLQASSLDVQVLQSSAPHEIYKKNISAIRLAVKQATYAVFEVKLCRWV